MGGRRGSEGGGGWKTGRHSLSEVGGLRSSPREAPWELSVMGLSWSDLISRSHRREILAKKPGRPGGCMKIGYTSPLWGERKTRREKSPEGASRIADNLFSCGGETSKA